MKIKFLNLLFIIFLLTSCKQEIAKTPEELRLELWSQESSKPNDYLELNTVTLERNKIKEVKKYIYKNKINKNILLSNIIDPNITKNTYQMLEKGLQIEQLELIDVKDINSIEEFKILTLKNKEESEIEIEELTSVS